MPSDSAPSAGSGAPRHAVVTGTSAGLGRAIAERLLADGWRVSGLDRAKAVVSHASFTAVQVDLADAAARDAALARLDAPEALVHAAGFMTVGRLGALDVRDGESMWRLHVAAATRLADALVPRMAAAGFGRVVLIGSRVAGGMPGRSQYAAAKAALIGLARSWAAEVVASGVTVNVVSPAATDTGMLADPARATSAPRLPPIGRLIRPDEVASLAAYLLSDAAAAITGQEIRICGGASLAT